METQELKQLLEEKETLLKRTETIYQQVAGQIALLRDLIRKNETKKEEVKEENKE